MEYKEFIDRVKNQGTQIDTIPEAERATRATLQTLAENLNWTEQNEVAAQLPVGLKEYFQAQQAGASSPSSLEEFYQRVGERENVDRSQAVNHVSAVMHVFKESISPEKLDSIRAQLASEFNLLFAG
jgi:uncharacterized protein (DUF2267 family)